MIYISHIKAQDEKELQRKICKKLNAYGYHFKKEIDSFFCDIVDYTVKAFGEVKTNGNFAPQQLLYGIAKEGVKDAQYLILANEYELRIYDPPEFEDIVAFAKKQSSDLSLSPSQLTLKRQEKEAYDLLGLHKLIYTYNGKFTIDEKQPCIFLDENNYLYFQEVLTKYRIDPAKFIVQFSNTWVEKSRLFIKNDNRTIFDQESGNEMKAGRSILNNFDRILIRSIRIKSDNIKEIIHKIDSLAPQDIRRNRGKYWSSLSVSEIATDLVREYIDPTFIFEPFVGGGSLIRDFVPYVQGIVNDIDASSVELLEKEWEGYDWKFHKRNLFVVPMRELLMEWNIPSKEETDTFCIYTNPPFGTSSTNALASSKKDLERMKILGIESRSTKIQYGSDKRESKYLGDMYGRGDLVLPAIARMIEIIKHRGDGYIATFSPFGVMLGRKRYVKVLKALLKDFEFVYGEVFGGDMFNGINKDKAISFTIWKYHKGCNTSQEGLSFWYEGKEFYTKFLPLLKDGWNYGNGHVNKNNLCIPRNERFCISASKNFGINMKKSSGSEVNPINVKIDINNVNIPSELAYSLWSSILGYHSFIPHPFPFSDCYIHLPNFGFNKSKEILSYILLYSIITELKLLRTEGKIGFIGMNRIFKFGGDTLTKGAKYLIETYKDCPVGESLTIGKVFERLKNNEEPDEIDKNLRILIKKEIEKRLDDIGYWEYLPVPKLKLNIDTKKRGILEYLS